MMFLALVIALLALQVWGSGEPVQRDDWFVRWCSRIASWPVGAAGRLALAVLVPVVVARGLLNALDDTFFGLLWIALAALLLLYSFGRGDFQQRMSEYRRHCGSADFEGAYLATLGEAGRADAGRADAEVEPDNPLEVHALVQQGFCYEGYQRWFAVLFYFVLLGPAGALAYRLLQLCRTSLEQELASRCLLLADWVPARLLAVTFSLVGDFLRSREALLAVLPAAPLAISSLLYRVGSAALGGASPCAPEAPVADRAVSENEELGRLLSRSAACWVAIIALLVLLG